MTDIDPKITPDGGTHSNGNLDSDSVADHGSTRPIGHAPSEPTNDPATMASEGDLLGVPSIIGESYGSLLHSRQLDPEGEAQGERYSPERCLGQGSNGSVWALVDSRLSRIIAMKVLNPGGDRKSFIEEARITAELQHPNVLPVYDLALTAQGDPCFAMKSVEGMSLQEALDCLPPPAATASIPGLVSVFIAIAQALAYAHDRGLIHQDVKPDNIMIGKFGEVLLVDWGCAVRGEARGDNMYGTPLYMAPEQARHEFADARSDVYCLGATMFRACAGRLPTDPGNDPDSFWSRKRAGTIDPLTNEERARIPTPLSAIIFACMAAKPESRYADGKAVLADLTAYQAGLAISAYRESLPRLLLRWYRRHRTQCWSALIALAVVVSVSALWADQKKRERSDWRLQSSEDFSDPIASRQRWTARATPDFQLAAQRLPSLEEIPLASDSRTALVSGHLEYGSEDAVVDVVLREKIYGSFAVDWDFTPLWGNQNLNCFLGDDRQHAYTFHVAGWGDPTSVILTHGNGKDDEGGRTLAAVHMHEPIQKKKTYRFRIEREGSRIRLAIDGRILIDHEDPLDPQSVGRLRIGFDTWLGSRNAVSNVRIWSRPLPELVSPLTVASLLAESGDPTAAWQQYDHLAHAYAGSHLGDESDFRAALMRLRVQPGPETEQIAYDVITRHPKHAFSPYALVEIHAAAMKRKDRKAAERARLALLEYPRHPARQHVLFEIGSDRIQDFTTPPGSKDFMPRPPEGAMAAVQQAVDEVELWAERYGERIAANRMMESASVSIHQCGRDDIVIAHWPARDRARGFALIETGHLEEALRDWRHLTGVEFNAYQGLDRMKELATTGKAGALRAMTLKNDLPGLCREFPHDYETGQALIAAGRAIEVVEDTVFGAGTRGWALASLGRTQEALDLCLEFDHHLKARCLIGLGREDEALTTCPLDYYAGYMVVLEQCRRGDVAGAVRTLDRLRPYTPAYFSDYDLLAYYVIPVLLVRDEGDADHARKLLAATLPLTRSCASQRFWHLASYATGQEDAGGFLSQSWKEGVDQRMRFAEALRLDLSAKGPEAAAAWREWLAHDHRMDLEDLGRQIAAWRIGVCER